MQIAEESDSIEVRWATEFLSSTPANSGFEKTVLGFKNPRLYLPKLFFESKSIY